MMPKFVSWFGGALVIGIVVLVAVGAIHDIMIGERNIRGEIVTLVSIAFIVLATLGLKAMQSRKSQRTKKRRKGAR